MTNLTPAKNTDINAMPVGMREVSKDEFWRLVMAEKRNIHPTHEPHHTDWFLVNTRQVWGWVSTGYRSDRYLGETTHFAVAQ